jgi:hypothetical protein
MYNLSNFCSILSNLASKVLRISSTFIWKSNELSSYGELRRIITSVGEELGYSFESTTVFEASGREFEASARSFFFSETRGG